MIDELREYEFTAQAWAQYWELFQTLCLPIRADNYGALQGMWQERVGDTVYFRHVWRYESLDERARLRAELSKVPAWRDEFLPQAGPKVSRQFLQVLNPRCELNAQRLAPARFIHLYRCPTGKAPALIEQILLSSARPGHSICAVWATEFSDPNQVVVMTSQPEAPFLELKQAASIETHCVQPLGIDPR